MTSQFNPEIYLDGGVTLPQLQVLAKPKLLQVAAYCEIDLPPGIAKLEIARRIAINICDEQRKEYEAEKRKAKADLKRSEEKAKAENRVQAENERRREEEKQETCDVGRRKNSAERRISGVEMQRFSVKMQRFSVRFSVKMQRFSVGWRPHNAKRRRVLGTQPWKPNG